MNTVLFHSFRTLLAIGVTIKHIGTCTCGKEWIDFKPQHQVAVFRSTHINNTHISIRSILEHFQV